MGEGTEAGTTLRVCAAVLACCLAGASLPLPQSLAGESAAEGTESAASANSGAERARTMTATKKGTWRYRKTGGKKVKVAYRFADGTYPTTITRIGRTVYYFDNATGKLGRSSKRIRLKKIDGELYAIGRDGRLLEGWQHSGNRLYYFGKSYHAAAKGSSPDGIELSESGTAVMNLNATLKLKCEKLLDKIVAPGASRKKKLKAAWKWTTKRSRFRYVNYEVKTSDRSWAKRYANEMIDTHLGECQGFAALFCALAEEIGYEPYLVSGRVPGSRDHAADGYTGHACVMIGGKWYDPEAQFAGWAMGIYGKSRYPMGFKSKKLHRFSAYVGTGAALGITKGFNGKISCSIGVRGGKYYCYSKGRRLTGLRCLKGKLYKFDRKGYMKKSLFRKVQSAAREGQPWAKLRALIGRPGKSQSANSCYGEGTDHVYTYSHVRITTFEPSDSNAETVVSHVTL